MIYWLALAAALLPVLVWLVVLYRADRFEPEPRRLIAKLFGLGVVSLFVAAFASVAASRVVPVPEVASGSVAEVFLDLVVAVFVFALVEEAAKLGFAWWATRRDPEFDEPLDGMIYAGTVALGFAAAENFLYIVDGLALEMTGAPTVLSNSWVLGPGVVQAFFVTAPLRALMSSIGHLTWTGMAGYFLARHRLGGASRALVFEALVGAAALHAAYNLPLFVTGALADRPGTELASAALLFLAWPAAWLVALEVFLVLAGRAAGASPYRARSLGTEDARTADARAEFHRRRVRQFTVLPLLGVLLLWLPGALGRFGFPGEVSFASGFALVAGAIGFSRYNWRCPACGAHFGWRYPRACRRCGTVVRPPARISG